MFDGSSDPLSLLLPQLSTEGTSRLMKKHCMLGHVCGFDVCRKLLSLPLSSLLSVNPVCGWCAVFRSFPQEIVSRAARVIYRKAGAKANC